MLQQTQAARVVPAYVSFIRRFPTIRSLSNAGRGEVVAAWDGLGYNRRALALSEAARVICRELSARVPEDSVELRRLPGIGPYTAAAVASLAFGRRVAAVDTNVRRVVARALIGMEAHDVPDPAISEAAERWVPVTDPGSWNQALMDLGREICRPRPRCDRCPLAVGCRFRSLGTQPRPSGRRRTPFEGSVRQVRGAVVRSLRDRSPATIDQLVRATGFPPERIEPAVRGLRADGLITAGPAALAGHPRGVVRLVS